jgi:ATP-dependent protease HslVU (ClpYQ) peptidase subunit
MTCIVGIVDVENNKVVIGGDSASTAGDEILLTKHSKVFRNGEFLIGACGSVRMGQLLQYSFIPPDIKGDDIHRYMCTDFIEEARKLFKDGGYLQKSQYGDDLGGSFLVGYQDRLFQVESDFQVAEYLGGFTACGSGARYALGALRTLYLQKIDAHTKVKHALEASATYCTSVAPPYNILET